jgi:hypothetical protein
VTRHVGLGEARVIFLTSPGPAARTQPTACCARYGYGFDRTALTLALDALLSVPELELMDEIAVERALHLFRQDGAPDFADCLHISVADLASQGPLLTFDLGAASTEGALLLPRTVQDDRTLPIPAPD